MLQAAEMRSTPPQAFGDAVIVAFSPVVCSSITRTSHPRSVEEETISMRSRPRSAWTQFR